MQQSRVQYAFIGLCFAIISGVSACSDQTGAIYGSRQIDGATAALVNGEAIYISDVELEAVAQGKIEPGDAFDAEHPDFQPVLDQLIDQRLLAQEAVARGLDLDAAARRRLEAGRERILGNILVESLVASEVNESAIDEMYAAQVKLQQIDDEVRLRHILLETEEEAAEVRSALEGGAEFTDTAFQRSTDTQTRLDGGSFGWISPTEMIDPFPEVIGDTKTGSLNGPFETEQGWHVIRVDERRTRPPQTKEEMRPEIITFLTFTQISDILSDLRNKADIRPRDGFDEPSQSSSGETPVEADPPAPSDETVPEE